MIIDRIALSGDEAYLRSGDRINLGGSGISYPVTGRIRDIGDGELLQVDGLDLLIEGDNLSSLFRKQSQPLLSIDIKKEMFPGLYADPYAHRVHNLAGIEDLKQGEGKGYRVLEVQGIPTLVSKGGEEECIWKSATYKLPTPATLSAAAWELATSRLTPEDAFEYELTLLHLREGGSTPVPITLAGRGTKPHAARAVEFQPEQMPRGVVAYAIKFEAKVDRDAFLRERHVGAPRESLGHPLLSGVGLLESVPAAHEFHSLHELLLASASYELFEEHGGPLRRLTVGLGITAALVENESISIQVHKDCFDYLEARVDATLLMRPPAPEKRT